MSRRMGPRDAASQAFLAFRRLAGLNLPRARFGSRCLVAGPESLGLGVLLCCMGTQVRIAGDRWPDERREPLLRELLLRLRAEGCWLDPDPILGALSCGGLPPGRMERVDLGARSCEAYDLIVGLGVADAQLTLLAEAAARTLAPGGLIALLTADQAEAELGRAALAQAGLERSRCEGDPPAALAGGLAGGLPTEFPTELLDEQILAHSRARYSLIAGLARGRRVLDVGCGSGMGTRRLAEAGARSLVGVEGSPEALELATRAPCPPGVALDWRLVDLERGLQELPDGAFDLVVCLEVLEHVRDQKLLVSELRRVLAPEGVLALSVPHSAFEQRWRALGVVNPYHLHVPDLAELRAHLAGFPSLSLFVQSDLAASLLRPLDGRLAGPLPVHVSAPGRLLDEGTFSILALAGPAGFDPGPCLAPEGWAHADHQAVVQALSAECHRLREELERAQAGAARAKWISLGYPSGNGETWLERALGHARWLGSDLVRTLRRR